MLHQKRRNCFWILVLWVTLLVHQIDILAVPPAYKVEDMPTPPTKMKTQQIDALTFLPNGKLAVCLPSGEIYLYDLKQKKWSLFAEGLHNPLGVLALSDSELVVTQRPEMTLVKDTDGDGTADFFKTMTDQFGMSGNYHEFNFTPVRSGDGGFFFALGTASGLAGNRVLVRGQFSPEGRPGRMFSSVPYRGWVMKYTADGRTIPWASGLRTPNGLGMDGKGNLFCTDNQGDWLGSSKLYHIERGKFYGHPSSLAWQKNFKGAPLDRTPKELDAMRTRAAIVFPQGIMANSPTQPILIDEKADFGPFKGQMLVGEMNQPRIIRLMLEKVDGVMQGACIPMIDGKPLVPGNNRLAWGPDGALYVGHTKHTWPGSQGLQRVIYNGDMPFELHSMNLTETGFKLTFTKPVDRDIAGKNETWQMQRYYYAYQRKYGSKQHDVTPIKVKKVKVSSDGKVVELVLDKVTAWYLHELKFKDLKAADGQKIENHLAVYTVNRLIKDTPSPPVQYTDVK